MAKKRLCPQPKEGQLSKFIGERESWKLVQEALTVTTGSEFDVKLYKPMANRFQELLGEIIRCSEEGDPFIISYYACAPEIYVAMDLPWFTSLASAYLGAILPGHTAEVDESDTWLGKDYCTALRVSALRVLKDELPIPTAVVALIHPCDGVIGFHQMLKAKWPDVPIFALDPPYWEDDERSVDYYVGEIKRMVFFLEEHTERKLDMDRLREVVEESNKIIELWQEYSELRRAVPCPHGYGITMQTFGAAQYVWIGDPACTQWFRNLVANAEELVRAKKGKVENERIRIFWFDLTPAHLVFDLFVWLEEQWGAVIVMDMFGHCPYELIDTSSEEAMFKGLARRALYQQPMVRQARGVADNFLGDIERVVKEYKINCVVWPMHMGHKDGSAIVGLMREKCREIGVPFMSIGMDLFDPRYTTVGEIKDRFTEFFTVMELG
jgi:benzoyl-CoA reductase subunit B